MRVFDPVLEPDQYPPTVPQFASDDEAAEFWDTHSSIPYLDQMDAEFDSRTWLDPSVEESAAEQMEIATFAIPHDSMVKLRAIADARKLPYQELIREWVGERLGRESAEGTSRPERQAS